jgi:hypothetical protein
VVPERLVMGAAVHYVLDVPTGGSKIVRVRLSGKPIANAFAQFENIIVERLADAEEFYDRITPHNLAEDEKRVHRQALAGMLWSKQFTILTSTSGWTNTMRIH